MTGGEPAARGHGDVVDTDRPQPVGSGLDQPAAGDADRSPADVTAGSASGTELDTGTEMDTGTGADTGTGTIEADRPGTRESPFSTAQLVRLDRALRVADASTGLRFSVYLGPLDEPSREHAEKLLAQLAEPEGSVLVAVSPNQRVLEIVTGSRARRELPDRACKLAALSMSAAFSGGDLAGGIIVGLSQLADHAARHA